MANQKSKKVRQKEKKERQRKSFWSKIKFYVVLAIVAYFVLSVPFWAVWHKVKRQSLNSESIVIEAVVIDEENIPPNGHMSEPTYSYQFEVEGEKYKYDSQIRGLRVGQKILIEYSPSHPSFNRPVKRLNDEGNLETAVGTTASTSIYFYLLLSAMIGLVIYSVRKKLEGKLREIDLVYRTYPRLLTTGTSFFLSLICLIFLMHVIFNISNWENLIVKISLVLLSTSLTSVSLFYLFKTKVIHITKNELVISYFFFGKRHCIDFLNIKTISQSKRTRVVTGAVAETILSHGRSERKWTTYKTTIEIIDGKNITVNSVGSMDFYDLKKAFDKQKRGEGKVKKYEGSLIDYLFDNIWGVGLNIVLLFIVMLIFYFVVYGG
jgi:hypothetical protein